MQICHLPETSPQFIFLFKKQNLELRVFKTKFPCHSSDTLTNLSKNPTNIPTLFLYLLSDGSEFTLENTKQSKTII